MPIRTTHTYALLDVSDATYREIEKKLIDAGYTIDDGTIDMHGIALVTTCLCRGTGTSLMLECGELRGHRGRHKAGGFAWKDGEIPERIAF